jgi:hypothetical protein
MKKSNEISLEMEWKEKEEKLREELINAENCIQ